MPLSKIAIAITVAGLAMTALPAQAQDAAAQFYKGRNLDLIIGAAPGGGYDVYARVIARHIDRHIPGKPTIVPKNMPGAGSNKAAAFLYSVAPKDGSVMGAVFSGAIMDPLLGDRSQIQHDPTKFNYLGSANDEVSVCAIRSDAPAKTLQEAMDKTVLLGASAAGGSTRDFPAVLNNLLGTKFNLVSGYPGTKEITLAIERMEVQGLCGYYWSSASTQNPEWGKPSGGMTILVQEAMKGHPELNKKGIPVAIDFAKNAEDRQVLEFFYSQLVFGRPYILPPGVPEARVKVLRKAFDDVLKDKELLADAEKSRIEILPVSGEEVQALVTKLFATPQAIIDRTKEAQIYKK
jgi:tripartite-type tricarboxylate transporter receptor subunit TctC